jgi:hypothetical protein
MNETTKRIFTIRGVKVMLYRDFAALYEVETSILKRNVRRQKKGSLPI